VILLFLCQICSFIIENSSGAKSSPKRRRLTSIKYKKKRPGLRRVWPGGPGPGSTGFHQANSQAGFCLHPDRSHAQVGRVPGRPAGPVRVLKLWLSLPLDLIYRDLGSNSFFFIKLPKIWIHQCYYYYCTR
jgi:hypothetical protein